MCNMFIYRILFSYTCIKRSQDILTAYVNVYSATEMFFWKICSLNFVNHTNINLYKQWKVQLLPNKDNLKENKIPNCPSLVSILIKVYSMQVSRPSSHYKLLVCTTQDLTLDKQKRRILCKLYERIRTTGLKNCVNIKVAR